jgi:hypothetical protein
MHAFDAPSARNRCSNKVLWNVRQGTPGVRCSFRKRWRFLIPNGRTTVHHAARLTFRQGHGVPLEIRLDCFRDKEKWHTTASTGVGRLPPSRSKSTKGREAYSCPGYLVSGTLRLSDKFEALVGIPCNRVGMVHVCIIGKLSSLHQRYGIHTYNNHYQCNTSPEADFCYHGHHVSESCVIVSSLMLGDILFQLRMHAARPSTGGTPCTERSSLPM